MTSVVGILLLLVPLGLSARAVARVRRGRVSGAFLTSLLLFALCGLAFLAVGFGTGMTADGSPGNPCGGLSRTGAYLYLYWIPAVFFVGGLAPLAAVVARRPWWGRPVRVAAASWTVAVFGYALDRGLTSAPSICGNPPGKDYEGLVYTSIGLTVGWFLGLAALALVLERRWRRTHRQPRPIAPRGIPDEL